MVGAVPGDHGGDLVAEQRAAHAGAFLEHPKDWLAHFLAYLSLAFSLGRATGRRGWHW